MPEEALKEFLAYLDDDDRQERIDTIKRTPTIVDRMGADLSRKYLMPALEERLDAYTLEDEVLYYLGQELPNLYRSLNDDIDTLTPIFDKLLRCEDTSVRAVAVDSLTAIAAKMTDDEIVAKIYPFVVGLLDGDWFTGKCSACTLFVHCYPRVGEEQRAMIRTKCKELVQDESPLAKRTMANQLESLASAVEKVHVVDDFVPLFDELAEDDQDSVRMLAINLGISIAKRLTQKEIEELVLQKLLNLGCDVSWRVKHKFASEIDKIQRAFGGDLTRRHLINVVEQLAGDHEAQIREELARNIATFCTQLQDSHVPTSDDKIDPIITGTFFKIIRELDKDPSDAVVEALSGSLLTVTRLLGKRYAKEFLLPIFHDKIVNDSDASGKIKDYVVTNVNETIKAIGYDEDAETSDAIDAMIDEMSRSVVWRTRRNVFVTLNDIARHVDAARFDARFLAIYEHLLSDCVTAVRRTGTLLLPTLIETYGDAWTYDRLVPIFERHLDDHGNYKTTMMFAHIVDEVVAPFADRDRLRRYVERHRDAQLASVRTLTRLVGDELRHHRIDADLLAERCESDAYFNDAASAYAEDVRDELAYAPSDTRANDRHLITTLKLIVTTFVGGLTRCANNHAVRNVQLRALNSLKNVHRLWTNLTEIAGVDGEEADEDEAAVAADLRRFVDDHKLRNEIRATVEKIMNETDAALNVLELKDGATDGYEPLVVEPIGDDREVERISKSCTGDGDNGGDAKSGENGDLPEIGETASEVP